MATCGFQSRSRTPPEKVTDPSAAAGSAPSGRWSGCAIGQQRLGDAPAGGRAGPDQGLGGVLAKGHVVMAGKGVGVGLEGKGVRLRRIVSQPSSSCTAASGGCSGTRRASAAQLTAANPSSNLRSPAGSLCQPL